VFLYRLNPPRPAFPADMTPAEGAAMQQHFAYWRERIAEGTALLVGPVMDPDGNHGIAILDVEDRAAASAICAADPILSGGLGFTCKLCDMPKALIRDAR
jgi:hypothetical protein